MRRASLFQMNMLMSTIGWVLMVTAGRSQQPSLTWLGVPGLSGSSDAYAVSADGSVVVGQANGRAFRWTAQGGMQYLGDWGGGRSIAYGVSADGSVVVGGASYPTGLWRAFRWTATQGMQDIGRQIDYYSWARGVSADGNMVAIAALYISSTGELPHPFWWTPSDGMQILMNPQGVGVGAAYGVSVDGHVVVGWALNSAWRTRAFRWVYPGRGGQNLGTLLDGGKDMDGGVGQAYGASGDGSVVIGGAYNAALRESAFRWTEDGGMQELGTLPGYNSSVAYGVSADGLVVVGEAHNGVRGASGSRAFRWTASGGMEDLNITYASLLTNGSVLLAARAISPNGRYIVGYGYNAATGRYEAFLLDVGTSR